MPNPQQPELRQSGHGATSDDSAKDRPDHQLRHDADPLPDHLVPEDNRPGHQPERPQDQPDLDRFAERLGLRDQDDEADGAGNDSDDASD